MSRFYSAHLCASPRSSDHIILQRELEIRRMASEDSENRDSFDRLTLEFESALCELGDRLVASG